MDKPLVAIEISSQQIKLVIGYVIKNQPYVIYASTKPLQSLVNSGTCENKEEVISLLNSFAHIDDTSSHLKFNVNEALFALPPYGLEAFDVKQATSVISSAQKVCEIDINNIYNIIRNGTLPVQNRLIEIVPTTYYLDNHRAYNVPPYGETSRTLMISGKVYTLPGRLIDNYNGIISHCPIKSTRQLISSYAASKLIASYPNIPNDFFLVDIGSHVTTVSLIGKHQLFAGRHFSWGGNNITEKIMEIFNINESDAEKYKIIYGLDKRENKFSAPVCETNDGNGNIIKRYQEDLNNAIKEELDDFITQLNVATNELSKQCDLPNKRIPLYIIGGGSKLKGLCEYLLPKVESDVVETIIPKTFGARDPSYFNCLGMIYVHSQFASAIDETEQPKLTNVSREG